MRTFGKLCLAVGVLVGFLSFLDIFTGDRSNGMYTTDWVLILGSIACVLLGIGGLIIGKKPEGHNEWFERTSYYRLFWQYYKENKIPHVFISETMSAGFERDDAATKRSDKEITKSLRVWITATAIILPVGIVLAIVAHFSPTKRLSEMLECIAMLSVMVLFGFWHWWWTETRWYILRVRQTEERDIVQELESSASDLMALLKALQAEPEMMSWTQQEFQEYAVTLLKELSTKIMDIEHLGHGTPVSTEPEAENDKKRFKELYGIFSKAGLVSGSYAQFFPA